MNDIPSVDETKDTLSYGESDKCLCGQEKPKTVSRSVICEQCKKAICMMIGCKYQACLTTGVFNHQRRDHSKEDQLKFTQYRINHCECGALKVKTDENEDNSCSKCNRFWCSFGNCHGTFLSKNNFLKHKKCCPYKHPEYENKCSRCCGPKTRDGVATSAVCPNQNCKRHWCLIDVCTFECDNERAIRTHQGRLHLLF